MATMSAPVSGPYWPSMRLPLTSTPPKPPRSSISTPPLVENNRACSRPIRQLSSRISFCAPLPMMLSSGTCGTRQLPSLSNNSTSSIALSPVVGNVHG